jgi:hypothetical protein
LARLYLRKKDLPGIDPKHRPPFRTKLELAVELLRWAKPWLGLLGLTIRVAAGGAYAKADFHKPAKALGMTVVSRRRKDAALRTLPGPRQVGKRGRPGTYGACKIDLAKRGGQRRGWSSGTLWNHQVVGRRRRDCRGRVARLLRWVGWLAQARVPSLSMGPGKCEGNNCDCTAFKRKVVNDDKCARCIHFYENHGF